MIERRQTDGSITGNAEADEFLRHNPNGLALGALYDQQMRAELAFSGAYRLHERLGHLDFSRIATMDPEEFAAVFRQPPSIHRFGQMMAGRTQKLAAYLSGQGGDLTSFWRDSPSDAELTRRFEGLPGFGKSKAAVLLRALSLFGHRAAAE